MLPAWIISFLKAESRLFFFLFSAINTLYWKGFKKCLLIEQIKYQNIFKRNKFLPEQNSNHLFQLLK